MRNITQQTVEEETPTYEIVRSEVNLLLFPFFALSNQEMGKKEETTFTQTIQRNGDQMELLWNVIPSRKFGHPGPFDKDVFRELEQMVDEKGYPVENPINFTTYELCKRLEMPIGGWQYKLINQSLERITTTSIKSKGTFYHKGGKKWVNDVFHIYDRVIFKGQELPDGNVAQTNHLYLSQVYLESLNAQYVKPLNYSYWKALQKPLSKRLYEILGVKFYGALCKGHSFIRYRYDTLCQLLPIKPQKYPSQAKQKLEPGHKELVQTGFLRDVTWEDWLIYYFPGSRAVEEIDNYRIKTEVKQESQSPEEPDSGEEEWLSEWKSKSAEEKAEEMLDRWLMMQEALRRKPSKKDIEAKRKELRAEYQ